MVFLRQQHHDTLQQLHREIERLKNENRGESDFICSVRCDDHRDIGSGTAAFPIMPVIDTTLNKELVTGIASLHNICDVIYYSMFI